MVSPDGYQNADSVSFVGTNGIVYMNATGTTGTTNTLSVYAKATSGTSAKFRFFGNGNTLSSSDFTATNVWQRFEFSYNCTQVTAGLRSPSTGDSNVTFYGFQHEAGAYATSYIPTTSAAVTRVADYAYSNQSPTANFGSGAFSVFVDIENVDNAAGDLSTPTAFIGNRQSGEWWRFYGNPSDNTVYFEASTTAGGYIATNIGTVTAFKNGRNKVAISRSATRFICYVNGVEKINNTNAAYLQNFDSTNGRIELNAWQNGANAPTNAKFNQLLIFKGTALTAAQLAEITTL
jgi:hypothetical protein